MSKQPDTDQIKEDIEKLVKDVKNVFGSLTDIFKSEVSQKKEEFEGQLHNIKNKISEHAPKGNTLQYVGIAFVVGVVVGAMFNSKKKD